MTPVFIYAILSFLIFCPVYFGKIRKGLSLSYSLAELIPFYLLSRVCPLMMMENRESGNITAFIVDIAVLAVIYAVAQKTRKNGRSAVVLYMFCPLPVISIAVGSVPVTAASAIICLAALAWAAAAPKKETSPSVYFPSYVMLSSGIFFIVYSALCAERSLAELKSPGKEDIFNIAGIVLLAAGLITLVMKQAAVIKGKASKEKTDAKPEESVSYKPEKFGKKNIIHIIILTVIYAAAVTYQIGSHEIPETGIRFNSSDPENTEFIVDLGEYKTVSKLEFFLGQESLRNVSVSTYNEVQGEWIAITTEEMQTSFAWNTINVSWNIRYIGLVFSASDTYINELVIFDDQGNKITPVNTYERPELFDEQDLYPEHTTYFYRMMFDEIYHGRTGFEFLHNLQIYENTHPPLGKTIISIGIALFGMNPFGWRIMCAVFGTLLVPVIYLFVWKISKRADTAFTGGILIVTDFMHFTLSRIATIDIIVAQFIMMMFFFMYCFTEELINKGSFKKQSIWLALSGISAGLAIATKWTGLYGAAGIAVIFFTFLIKHCAASGKFKDSLPYLRKLCLVCIASFIIVPLTVYALSYIEFSQSYPDKNIIQHAVENAKSMLSYHSEVKAPHPYQSPWYYWLIDKQPLLDAITILDDDKISSIATFGNPLIFLGGFAAFIYNVYLWRCKKNAAAQFLCLAYLSMLIPWFFIHRTVFIYQYFGCDLIMIPLICNALINPCRKIKGKEAAVIVVSLALFVMFFPELSGISVSRSYTDKVLEWLPTWIFE